MTADTDLREGRNLEPHSESYSEPRTIPKNWDVSAIDSSSTLSRNGKADQKVETNEPVETKSVEVRESDADFDPFPQPRTIPGMWDVSDMVPNSISNKK